MATRPARSPASPMRLASLASLASHASLATLASLLISVTLTACLGPHTRGLEGFVTADPAAVDMDGALLRAAGERLDGERRHGIDSMLVVRRGRLVSERYWNGHDA
ncbi:MAG: hypothetical protein JNK56_21195, partial [Myxococcales bacterium]|nr:hypothetical protein [Myxococcales bacterium]